MTLLTCGACDHLRYLHSKFPQFTFTLLASDAKIVSISKKYFYCETANNVKTLTGNILENLQSLEKASNLLILDCPNIEAGSPLSFPPKEFVDNVKVLKDSLANEGIIVINLGCRDGTLKGAIIDSLKSQFKLVFKSVLRIPSKNCFLMKIPRFSYVSRRFLSVSLLVGTIVSRHPGRIHLMFFLLIRIFLKPVRYLSPMKQNRLWDHILFGGAIDPNSFHSL